MQIIRTTIKTGNGGNGGNTYLLVEYSKLLVMEATRELAFKLKQKKRVEHVKPIVSLSVPYAQVMVEPAVQAGAIRVETEVTRAMAYATTAKTLRLCIVLLEQAMVVMV